MRSHTTQLMVTPWRLSSILALCALLGACQRDATAPESSAKPAEPAAVSAADEKEESAAPASPAEDEAAEPAPEPGAPAASPRKAGSAAEARGDALGESLPALLEALRTSDTTLSRLYGDTPKATPLAAEDSRCEAACTAFASLKRAAAGICRITGDDDERCTDAQKRVAHHQAKLASCACRD